MRERDPYPISESKRFEISKDAYSQERLQAIKEVFQEIKNSTPFGVAFSMYGSLSKGKKLDESNYFDADIDLSIYVDEESVESNFDEFFKDSSIVDIEQKKDMVRNLIKSKVQEKLHLLKSNGELSNNIWMYDISEDTVSDLINSVTEDSNFENSFELRKICRMFHLDVGGRMKKYRKYFFEHLLNQPAETREDLWQKVISTLMEKERYNQIPSQIESQYPKTFLAAYKYYAS